jgi:hypothetical protein
MRNELYRNNHDGSFTRVTNRLTQVYGNWENIPAATAADFDADGDMDVLIAQVPKAKATLFVSQFGQGTADFTSLPLTATGAVGSFADYDSDGWPDLYLTCHADFFGGGANALLHNDAGSFKVVTQTPLATPNEYIFDHNWIDYDEDGDSDFLGPPVRDSSMPGKANVLFQNQGDGSFLRVQDHVLINTLAPSQTACWGDYDNDGHLDVLLLRAKTSPGVLFRNLGQGQFVEDPGFALLDPSAGPTWCRWVDYDNDGDLDLYVAHETAPCRMFANDGTGKFSEVWLGNLTNPSTTYYAPSWGDYNNDGFPDLLAWGLSKPSFLFMNNAPQAGNQNHWLKVQLKGRASNPNGYGAVIRATATIGGKTVSQMWQLGIRGGSFPDDYMAHFGLGDATKVDTLRIEWPSGIVQELKDVAVDQKPYLTVVESQGALPDTKPQVTAQSRDTAGVFHATVTHPTANLRCVLEASTNLVQWTKVQVRTNVPPAAMEFIDVHATNQPVRFYRVVVP